MFLLIPHLQRGQESKAELLPAIFSREPEAASAPDCSYGLNLARKLS